MAKKKIIVSDGNGKYREISSSSFSVDGEILTIATASVATSSYGGGTSGSIMQVVDDRLIPIWSTSSIIERFDSAGTEIVPSNLSGTLFQYRTDDTLYSGISLGRVDTPSFSGDIVGTTGSASPAKVVSVANVQSGTLDSRFGGTGTGSFIVNSLVTLSGSGLNPSDAVDKIAMIDATNKWSFQDKNLLNFTPLTGAIVYLYTGSVSSTLTTSSFVWRKPGTEGAFPANVGTPRFIRVICQGGGGGGGGGSGAGNLGGIGGAGGGYADVTYDASYISSSVTCSVGWGGNKGAALVNGISGSSSSFGNYIYSLGGPGGLAANNTSTAVAIGGTAYNVFGGTGSAYVTGDAPAVATVTIGGAGGGGGSAGGSAGRQGGSITLLSLTASAGGIAGNPGGTAAPPQSGTMFPGYKCYINNTQSLVDLPYLLWAGGSGGGGGNASGVPCGSGSSPLYGSGGGGGGGRISSTGGPGGNGGSGYILIICT